MTESVSQSVILNLKSKLGWYNCNLVLLNRAPTISNQASANLRYYERGLGDAPQIVIFGAESTRINFASIVFNFTGIILNCASLHFKIEGSPSPFRKF